MKICRLLGAALLWVVLLSPSMAQEQDTANPYPLITHFLGKHRAFSATLVSAVQSEDGSVMEIGKAKYAYLDGKIRMESAFSEQWMALFAMSAPDTNAIKRAGMDAMVEICVPDKKKMYVIFPNAKTTCEMDLPPEIHPPQPGDLKVEREAAGTEVIDGHRCLKSKITIVEKRPGAEGQEEKMEGMLWEAEDLKGFPIKTEVHFGGMFRSTQVFTDVKLAEPNQSLFAPPAGFKRYQSVEEFAEAVQKRLATDEQRVAGFWKAAETGNVVQLESLTKQLPKLLQSCRPDGQTPLHVAARARQKEAVQWLIAKKVDVKAKDNKGLTALHEAADVGSRDIIELLVKAGAEIDAQAGDGRTPLLTASANAQKDAVESLLKFGASVDKQDSEGMTALHLAAVRGAKSVVALLLMSKAEPDAKNKRGLTPLWEATIQGYDDVVELLAVHGGDINAVGLDGQTPLGWAVINKRKTMVKTLVANRANGDISLNHQPLLLVAVAQGDLQLLDLVLSSVNNVDVKGPRGDTALHRAVSLGSVEMVKSLLARKPDVLAANNENDNPLHLTFHLAVQNPNKREQQREIAKMLIEVDPDLEACGYHGQPVLHLAAGTGWKDVVELLLAKGAVACAEADNVSAYMALPSWYARNVGHNDVADFLKPYEDECSSCIAELIQSFRSGNLAAFENQLHAAPELLRYHDRAGNTLLHLAAQAGRREFVDYLLSSGADPVWHGRFGHTLLQSAIKGGNVDLVKLFLQYGNDPNDIDINKQTALFYASNIEIAKLLLDYGANVNAVNIVRLTPVMVVPIPVAEYLLANGAKLTPSVEGGETPLHHATINGDKARIELLIAHGADVNTPGFGKETPLSAASNGHPDIAELLKRHGAK
jgi:ankyrin repeat protein